MARVWNCPINDGGLVLDFLRQRHQQYNQYHHYFVDRCLEAIRAVCISKRGKHPPHKFSIVSVAQQFPHRGSFIFLTNNGYKHYLKLRKSCWKVITKNN